MMTSDAPALAIKQGIRTNRLLVLELFAKLMFASTLASTWSPEFIIKQDEDHVSKPIQRSNCHLNGVWRSVDRLAGVGNKVRLEHGAWGMLEFSDQSSFGVKSFRSLQF